MNSQMYREHILELWKNPLNFGSLENATHEHEKNNTLCGDEIKVQLIVKNNKIENVKFSGTGCAISIASASLLTNKIKNLDISEVKNLASGEIIKMLHIPISPGRIKCATLSLEALRLSKQI